MAAGRQTKRSKAELEEAKEETENTNEMLQFIHDKVGNIDNIVSEMAELKKSMDFISKQYEDLKRQLKGYKNIKSKLEKLEKCVEEKDEIINDLQQRMVSGEQYSRRNHLEIGNLPVTEGEDVDQIVCGIGTKIGCPLKVEDIAVAHRLKAKDGAVPSIIVEFVSRRTRNEFFKQRKVLAPKDKNKRDKNRLYINESLCYYYRNLLKMAKERSKAAGYSYCWYANNKVLVRKAEKTKAIVIQNVEDLDKITEFDPNVAVVQSPKVQDVPVDFLGEQ